MMTFSKAGLAAALMAAFAYLPLHANAALFDDDEARKAILELRSKVDALARDLTERLDAKADKTSTLSLINQHDQTMQEIARLRGQIEVLAMNWPTRKNARKISIPTSTPACASSSRARSPSTARKRPSACPSKPRTTPPSACSSRATTRLPPPRSTPS